MQEALEVVQEWSNRNKMTINRNKTKDMWISFNTAISESELTIDYWKRGSGKIEISQIAECLASKQFEMELPC